MVRASDFSPVAPSLLALFAGAIDDDGPSSAPTVLVEVDEIAIPTALPAPPLVPYISASDGWRPSPLPITRPALALVRSQPRVSVRPTVRVPEQRSHEQLRAVHPSSPPSAPPPSPAMCRVA